MISEAHLEWSRLTVRGPQSLEFLQGQLSQDLALMSDDHAWALLLAPDSVVISSLYVTRVDDGFDLVVPRSLGEAALTRLRRFLLRTKCTLELSDVEAGPFATVVDQIAAGAPGPKEFARALTPHCFGASFVAATISFTKGCFTGQELVGRLDARHSSVPWRLVRVTGPTVARVDQVLGLKGPEGPRGVTSWTGDGDGVIALGIAHRTVLDPVVLATIDDVRVEPIA